MLFTCSLLSRVILFPSRAQESLKPRYGRRLIQVSHAHMSTTVEHANAQDVKVAEGGSMEKKKEHKGSGGLRDSKGFIAGVASGITKCTVGHPFDT